MSDADERPRLTARQRDVGELVATGLKPIEIARELEVSGSTVHSNLFQLRTIYGVQDNVALALCLRKHYGISAIDALITRCRTEPRTWCSP